jgi:hypothetical protein
MTFQVGDTVVMSKEQFTVIAIESKERYTLQKRIDGVKYFNCPGHLIKSINSLDLVLNAIRENFSSFEAFDKAYEEWKNDLHKR